MMEFIFAGLRGVGLVLLMIALAYVGVYLPQKWSGLHN